MTFDTEHALEQFRGVESEMFDFEGHLYSGIAISSNQCEMMRDLINMLNAELLPNLCESCSYHIAECKSHPLFSIDAIPRLTGELADKVIACGSFQGKAGDSIG